jgi:hypothetical protein
MRRIFRVLRGVTAPFSSLNGPGSDCLDGSVEVQVMRTHLSARRMTWA